MSETETDWIRFRTEFQQTIDVRNFMGALAVPPASSLRFTQVQSDIESNRIVHFHVEVKGDSQPWGDSVDTRSYTLRQPVAGANSLCTCARVPAGTNDDVNVFSLSRFVRFDRVTASRGTNSGGRMKIR